ncbi:MAG TPA: CBS domain-containing protein [Candidatus Nitrosopolaris sp.]|nr:CBS domain-containing protein [Candidatus Nitrosopolaris sp.]
MMILNNNIDTLPDKEERALRKKEVVTSLYRYSDLSIKNIAQQAGMSLDEVQGITEELAKSETLQSFVEKGTAKIEKIMSHNVASLDLSKIAADAAALMSEKKVGSVIVTKNGRPFGIVTERDLIRRYFRDTLLENMASHPLITSEPTTTVEEAAEIMLKNKIRKLPIIDENNLLAGILTVTDLATFLSPTRRPGLTLSVLRAISRGREPRCDSCNSTTEVQWCDGCNRFMCQTCDDEVHTVDLP